MERREARRYQEAMPSQPVPLTAETSPFDLSYWNRQLEQAQMSQEPRHLDQMTVEELRELVDEMSALALDLAQHLEYSARFLKRRKRETAILKACEMAYKLYLYPHEGPRVRLSGTRVATFDADGLHVDRGGDSLPAEEDRSMPTPGRPGDAAAGS